MTVVFFILKLDYAVVSQRDWGLLIKRYLCYQSVFLLLRNLPIVLLLPTRLLPTTHQTAVSRPAQRDCRSSAVRTIVLKLILEKSSLFSVQKDVPNRHHHYFDCLENDETAKPLALFFEQARFVSAKLSGGGAANYGLKEGDQDQEGSENPLHDSVNGFELLRDRRNVAKGLLLQVVPLSNVELKDARIYKISTRGKESEFEGEFESFRHICVRGSETGNVRRECHNSVEREQEGVEEQTCNVVYSLIENKAPDSRTAPSLIVHIIIVVVSPARI